MASQKFTLLKLVLLLFLLTKSSFLLSAQSPANLNADVTGNPNVSSVTAIENTFNQARRQEETQLNLGANAIKNLDLPDQATWNGMSIDQKALFILNDERTARAGIDYGNGPVKGLPFNGIEAAIDNVAQNWAQYNINNNIFEHCHPTRNNSDCPLGRIDAAYPANCTEFGGGIENLYASSSGTVSNDEAIVGAIYGWNYQDAGSAWGHRIANLNQGYDDDYGEAGQEGLVGFGIAQTTNGAVQWKTVVVVNFTNPVPGNCNYNITVATNSLPGGGGGGCTKPTVNQPTNQTVTANAMTTAINFTGTAGATYVWANNNTNIGLGASGNGNIPAFTVMNPGNMTITATITVTPSLNGCAGDSKIFTITVNPGGGGGCTPNITISAPALSGNTLAATSISTQGNVTVNGPTVLSSPTVNLHNGFTVPAGQCFEANVVGCNYNGTLSCNGGGGGNTGNGTCASPYVITCGQVFQGNNANGTNTWTIYDSGNAYTAPENVHTLVVPPGGNVTVTLAATADLDLLLAGNCSNALIVWSANENTGNETSGVTNNGASAATLYIIVDGWAGATSAYTLSCASNFVSEGVASARNNTLISLNRNTELITRKEQSTLTTTDAGSLGLTTSITPSEAVDLVVYPNPFHRNTTVQYQLSTNGTVHLYLNDLTGKRVTTLVDHQIVEKGSYQFTIDRGQLNSGMYYLTMQVNQQVVTKKLVVH